MPRAITRRLFAAGALLTLAGCTVQPMYGSGGTSSYRGEALYYVEPVETRVAQQVRNALIFGLNGGRNPNDAPYRLRLLVTATDRAVAVETNRQAPTSARVSVATAWTLTRGDAQVVASGERTAIAAYDRTVQRFANKRALLDAQNRAATEAAERVRLAVQQAVR